MKSIRFVLLAIEILQSFHRMIGGVTPMHDYLMRTSTVWIFEGTSMTRQPSKLESISNDISQAPCNPNGQSCIVHKPILHPSKYVRYSLYYVSRLNPWHSNFLP